MMEWELHLRLHIQNHSSKNVNQYNTKDQDDEQGQMIFTCPYILQKMPAGYFKNCELWGQATTLQLEEAGHAVQKMLPTVTLSRLRFGL